MKKFLSFILFFSLFLFPKPIFAASNPLASPNNSFGIHIINQSDLDYAAKLVNSSGGEWGYVTLVISQNDLNLKKWQSIFDQLRDLKLIPLVRLATIPQDDYWQKPNIDDIDQWVDFLSSLNWVIKNRYIIIFNEPNHQKEWGNSINPQEYAQILKLFAQKLANSSSDYFILPAGFDTAAPNSPSTMRATDYWLAMYRFDPQIFELLDGWNSHSYPNPNFSGSVNASGFGSIRSYQSEINYLKTLGLDPDLPIFITETGWINQGQILGASDNYIQAFQSAWNHPQIIAITPFILNYPQPPFNQFSWQIPDSNEFYPHYYAVQNLSKTKGQPEQIHLSQIIANNLPDQLIVNSSYTFNLDIKNIGQSIWNQDDFSFKITGDFNPDQVFTTSLQSLKPFSHQIIKINLTTPAEPSDRVLALQLQYQAKPFGDKLEKVITLVPPSNLLVRLKLWFKYSCPWCKG